MVRINRPAKLFSNLGALLFILAGIFSLSRNTLKGIQKEYIHYLPTFPGIALLIVGIAFLILLLVKLPGYLLKL